MLFFAPSDWEIKWQENGLIGAKRFLIRVWNLVESVQSNSPTVQQSAGLLDSRIAGLHRKMHQTIKRVTEDIDPKLEFNTAISAIMELVNEIYEVIGDKKEETGNPVVREAVKTAVILLAPMIPHIAEEMWEKMAEQNGVPTNVGGEKPSIFNHPWPKYDPAALVAQEVELVVQVSGKLKSRIIVATNATEEDIKKKALEDDKIKQILSGNPPRKIIVVPGRLVNIVP
jgi:leucyl-tRNA synthetase